MRASSAGSGPSSAASGMPCTLPDSLDAGLFMSPCASTQIRPSGLPCLRMVRRRRRDRSGAEAVIAAEHDRHRAFGERRERGLKQPLADARDVFHVALVRIARALRLGNRRRHVALVDDVQPERARAARRMPAMRNADGPMSVPRRLPPRSSGTPMM